MTLPPDARSLPFERWWNVRDLGGLPIRDGGTTRPGVLLRAASPEFASAADIDRARRLGLNTFVDLRIPGHTPDWRAAAPGAVTVGVNLVGSIDRPREAPAGQLLRLLLDAGRAQVARAVGTITAFALQSPPVVFHCHTGKDRTGLIAIVMLSLAGVPEENIVDDYLASNPGFEAMRAALTADPRLEFMAGAPAAFRGPVSRPGVEEALHFLQEAGGVEAYLQSSGLTSAEVVRAAALLRPVE
ncbi:MAG: tyrosine-protein phosphatase [Acidimicrobiia bacterium]|nr:tyrosine-protein phosphatase [Acidimicrobiia bacterium]